MIGRWASMTALQITLHQVVPRRKIGLKSALHDATVDAIECRWCENWEHKVCVNISTKEYSILGSVPSNIMFFCSTCIGKVPTALVTYDVNLKIGSLEQRVSVM